MSRFPIRIRRAIWLAALIVLSAFAAPPFSPPEMHAFDDRRDLPLLPMMADHQKRSMRNHLQAVSDIVAALAVGDFAAIEKSSSRIGFSEEMEHMCENFGRAAPGFTEQALAFHHTADRIGMAARARDQGQIIGALADTLVACTGCHAKWKQRVVDDETWEGLTMHGKVPARKDSLFPNNDIR